MSAPLVIGHRGAPGYRPEHSRSSFLLAVEQGAAALEVDIVPTADGTLAVRHEHVLNATTDVADRPEFAARARRGSGGRPEWWAEDFTGFELQTLRTRERAPQLRHLSAAYDDLEPVLLLSEVLELAARAEVLLVIEVKDSSRAAAAGFDLPALVMSELAAAPRLPRIVFESFEKSALRPLSQLGHPLVYLLDAVGMAADERARGAKGVTYRKELAEADFAGFAGLSLPLSMLSAARVRAFHQRGLQVWGWTLRIENAFLPAAHRDGDDRGAAGDWRSYWNTMIETGVDALFTDQPDLLSALLEARAPRGAASAAAATPDSTAAGPRSGSKASTRP